MMNVRLVALVLVSLALLVLLVSTVGLSVVAEDPLVRMPGTQPAQGVALESPNRCLNCHGGYSPATEPGYNWLGSMMAQAGRDYLFWSCLTVAGQDSMWAIQTPNAVDLCERCHFPAGWLGGRSDPPNASAMTADDLDGVSCDMCHRMYDPFHETTYAGLREGDKWLEYWDETNLSSTPSLAAAHDTLLEDRLQASQLMRFDGTPFFGLNGLPFSPYYVENGSGQYFVGTGGQKRASFADAAARHQMLYSRYHKSRYFCSSCHDVSNPVLANLTLGPEVPAGVLPTEWLSANSYFHVERTFSEFMLSDYGQQGGALGIGPFAPGVFETSDALNRVSKCQDCHMRDVVGAGCDKRGVPLRPIESVEHPKSGLPLHDLTGGNAWVSYVLASAVPGSPNYDPVNDSLLNAGPGVLTLDLAQGQGIDPVALLSGADRAMQQLELAAAIEGLSYDPATGALDFRIQNNTGHKLPSGFPEGRRMFVNIQVYAAGALIHEVNPYDVPAATLRGLDYPYFDPMTGLPPPAQPGPDEQCIDELVYEMHPSSSLTGEAKHTFHFVLADGRGKDNRVPPKGFRIAQAGQRLSEPVWLGGSAPGYFNTAEYAGGYDDVSVLVAPGGDFVKVGLYYQTTSREYVEFLRNEIRGDGPLTLPPGPSGNPYIIQTDAFFAQLRAWGDTIWHLWTHNRNLPGAAPVLMAEATVGTPPGPTCEPLTPSLLAAEAGNRSVALTWSDPYTDPAAAVGFRIYYDQAGKKLLLATVGRQTTYTDNGLTNGVEYCYSVSSVVDADGDGLWDCESGFSNVLCAIPFKATGGGWRK